MSDPTLRIFTVPHRTVVRLKAWQTGEEISVIPPGLGGQVRILSLGPDERLIVSDVIDARQLAGRLARHLAGCDVAVVDLSCALKTVRIEGSAAPDVLAKGCGLDLDPCSFPVGRATRTRLAQLSVIVECVDRAPTYDLYWGRSFATYFESWLNDAAT
jgi:sarcosine oxidase, subunit gamma